MSDVKKKRALKTTTKVTNNAKTATNNQSDLSFRSRASAKTNAKTKNTSKKVISKIGSKPISVKSARVVKQDKPRSSDSRLLKLTHALAGVCLDKKALRVCAYDVQSILGYTDYVVLASVESNRQSKTIAEALTQCAREQFSIRPIGIEGVEHGLWVLVDFGDVVVHIFQEEQRRLYALEELFSNAQPLIL